MIFKKVSLSKEYDLQGKASLTCISPEWTDVDPSNKPALIVVPGGGYSFVSKREGDPIAISFLNKGYNCFVLDYKIGKPGQKQPLYPSPQLELAAAFHYVKTHAKEFYVDPKQIFIVGFSAGGHLVASYSLYHKEYAKVLGFGDVNIAPKGICLSYPVITTGDNTHLGTKTIITGNDPALIDKLSVELHVTKAYPPSFIWTTFDDACVPYTNSTILAEKLKKLGVKHEIHVFQKGVHGASRCDFLVGISNPDTFDPDIPNWINYCDKFFRSI